MSVTLNIMQSYCNVGQSWLCDMVMFCAVLHHTRERITTQLFIYICEHLGVQDMVTLYNTGWGVNVC